ncbi:hypothetical protein H0H93_013453, partial [Arthromyces matolae]
FRVLDLYRSSFDPHQEGNFDHHPPAHRYLFQAYAYQYHLIQSAWIVLEMLDEMIRLEKERNTQRLWTPVKRLFRWNNWQLSDTVRNGDDEDPDTTQGTPLSGRTMLREPTIVVTPPSIVYYNL